LHKPWVGFVGDGFERLYCPVEALELSSYSANCRRCRRPISRTTAFGFGPALREALLHGLEQLDLEIDFVREFLTRDSSPASRGRFPAGIRAICRICALTFAGALGTRSREASRNVAEAAFGTASATSAIAARSLSLSFSERSREKIVGSSN
jgi:hypothetical protein